MAGSGIGIAIGESGVGSVLNRHSLRVPLNQRSYAWDDHHVRTLLEDFSNAIASENKTYFLGTIVLTQTPDATWEVADGQQRLATTAILISAIRDHLSGGSPNEKEAARKYTQNFVLEFDELSGEHVPKLRLNVEDNDFFVKNALLAPESPGRGSAIKNTDSHSRISQAIAICKDHVQNVIKPYAKADQAKRLYEWIAFIRDNAVIIEIRVPDSFNAYTLFETLNDRGLRASQADILKNYLFGRAQDRLNEVAPKWASMTSILESLDVEDLLLTFLRHYWIAQTGPTIEKELADRIREKITGKQQTVDMANALASYSVDYAALFSPLEHAGWTSLDKPTRAYVYIMTRILQIEQIRPLLLAIVTHFESKEARTALKLCLTWSVRFLIAGGGGGGVLDRHYGLRAKEITSGEIKKASLLAERMKGIVKTDAEFSEGLKRARVSKKHLARYYLRSIELSRTNDPQPELGGILEDTTVFNLEHVLPINPDAAWNVGEEVVQAYARRLGNMTLLEPSVNVEIANKTFAAKQPIYKECKLSITSEIADFTKWGPEEIEERQAALTSDALKVWSS
jgi:hypothetical protein